MMKTHIVTTFSKDGYVKYGEYFIRCFDMFWPKEFNLLVYIEGDNKLPIMTEISNDRIKILDLLVESDGCREFLKRNKDKLEFQGKKKLDNHYWKPIALQENYNYRYDAYKFCRKVFSIEAALGIASDRLFWIDADTVTFKKIPVSVFNLLLPADKACSFLGRKRYYSECGLIGYNLKKPKAVALIDAVAESYDKEYFKRYREWHDSYVWDQLRISTMEPEDWYCIPSKMNNEPFESCALSAYATHLKGDKKHQTGSYFNRMLRGER